MSLVAMGGPYVHTGCNSRRFGEASTRCRQVRQTWMDLYYQRSKFQPHSNPSVVFQSRYQSLGERGGSVRGWLSLVHDDAL